MSYSLYKVMESSTGDKNLDEEKINDLELRIRGNTDDSRAATITNLLDSVEEDTWDDKSGTDFMDLMELISEYDSPSFNNFIEPKDATEFMDSPITLQITTDGYEEVNNEGKTIGPVDNFGKPIAGHPKFKLSNKNGKEELDPEDFFKEIAKKIAKKKIKDPWANAKNSISIRLLGPKGRVIDTTDIEGLLNKSPYKTDTKELIENNNELAKKLEEAAEYIEALSADLITLREVKSERVESEIDSDNKELVRLETPIGHLLYTPQAVQVESHVFLMYFHKNITPAFIPNIDRSVYVADWEGHRIAVQYLGGMYKDKINPDYTIMAFVRRFDHEN